MAQPRRTQYPRSNHQPLRRAPDARKRAFSATNHTLHSSQSSATESPPLSSRAVLIPLHLNLRRLPSRLLVPQTESMRDAAAAKSFVQAGTKRKRSVSGAENVTGARVIRGAGRYKRHKSSQDSSDEDAGSAMEVDAQGPWADDDSENDNSSGDSSDEYYLNDASSRELLRLRKDELVRLYSSAGLSDDAEHLTKHDLVQAIISARDDVAEVPPSSPSGFTSSDGSSDDGHFAGGEETDIGTGFRPGNGANGLRRRVTVQAMAPSARGRQAVTGRTMSLTQIDKPHINKLNIVKYPALGTRSSSRKSGSSSRSSPSVSAMSTGGLPSPPATRQRTRKLSADQSKHTQAKEKGKQVEFSRDVEVVDLERNEDSDLTDLAELEHVSPSPRRLRSKGEKTDRRVDCDLNRRVSSRRKVRHRVDSCQQKDEDEEVVDVSDDDECDELLSSPTQSMSSDPNTSRGRRTPVKHRLRPRPVQTHTPPSDGDDEDEDDETVLEDQFGSPEDDDETDELATPVRPRRLRNGKVVSDQQEVVEDEDEILADEDGDVQQEDETDSVLSESTSDVDAQEDSLEEEDETEIENEECDETIDNFDLSTATTKTLTRLRRDDLVKLCEGRELDVSGTKAQLAKALMEWRDRPSSESSCPSSTGTVRPSETTRVRANGRRKSRSKGDSPVQPPQTPPFSNERELEPELELDLESLGLHDREISPERITKLEKIGSGGFKDVFVGKLKGRRVAIAEFRGQLNSMDIKELKLLGDFSHQNIVRFLGVSIPENTRDTPVMIISELCSHGDLFDYIRGSSIPALRRMVCMMLDIARGLQYLHAHKPSVIHRDCKSSNILITSKGVAKITDFGLAKVKQSTRSMVRSLVGTVNWQAPELWHPHPKYNHKVDVFSCAMVFWEMLQWHLPSKKFPWEGMNEHAIYDLVGAKRQRPSTAGLRKQWHPELVDLIEKMWAQEHQDRPTMLEVVEQLEDFFNRF